MKRNTYTAHNMIGNRVSITAGSFIFIVDMSFIYYLFEKDDNRRVKQKLNQLIRIHPNNELVYEIQKKRISFADIFNRK